MIKLANLLKEALTEVSVEQLKAQFVDSGKISQKDFNEITNVTSKTAYMTWLAKKVVDKFVKAEDIYKFKKYFSVFDRRKKDYPFSDINQYKTYKDVIQFRATSIKIADEESEDPSKQKGISKGDKYKEFYMGSVDGYNVYELPKGRTDLYGVSCELGSGTEWCTATGKTKEHFDRYISKGPLFIFIKPGSTSKFQFSYETNSFMEEEDNSVFDIEWSEEEDKLIYDLFQFIENKDPKYRTPLKLKLRYGKNNKLTPEDLNIKGDFYLEAHGDINTLPDGLIINGDLDISSTNIKSLPNGLKVKGDLWMQRTDIQTLPKDLEIGGVLFIYDTPLARYDDDQIIKMCPNMMNVEIKRTYGDDY